MRNRHAFLLCAAVFLLLIQLPLQLAQTGNPSREATNPPWDPLAPEATVRLGFDPAQPGSCYYTAKVELAPRTPPGFWGLKIDLDSATNLFEGGLNFGSALAPNARGEAYIRFRIDNPAKERQLLTLQADIHFSMATFPSRPGVEAQLFLLREGEPRLPVSELSLSTPMDTADVHSLRLSSLAAPGEYLLALNTAPGSSWATFEAHLATRLASQLGGGFAGGVEVGGYLSHDREGASLINFAGFCISQAQEVHFRTIRQEGVQGLILRIADSARRILYDSTTAVTTTSTLSTTTTTQISFYREPIGYGNLTFNFDPNPVIDSGSGKHSYKYEIQETNGTGVNLSSLVIAGYQKDLDQWLGRRYLRPFGVVGGSVTTTFSQPTSSLVDRVWSITGSDDQGHTGLTWRGIAKLIPARSLDYGHLKISFSPNPAMPGSDGDRRFSLIIEESGGVGVDLTKLSLNGVPFPDFAQLLGGDKLLPHDTLIPNLRWPKAAASGKVVWKLEGKDTNGHTNLVWEADQDLIGSVPLLDGEWQNHEALESGLMPFQYTAFVPSNALRMTVEIEPLLSKAEASTRGPLSVYVRAGRPVEGPPLISDHSLTGVSSGSLLISSSALRRNQTYYVAITNSDSLQVVPFMIRVTYSYDTTPPTTYAATTTTTSTSTTRRATTTSTASTSTSRPPGSTTTTTIIIPPGISTATKPISSTTGAVVSTDDNHQLIVPAGAVPTKADGTPGNVTFTVQTNATPPVALPNGVQQLGKIVKFGPEDVTFAKPIQTSLPLPPNTDPSRVAVARYDPGSKTWYAYPFVFPEKNPTVVQVADTKLGYQTVVLKPWTGSLVSENGGKRSVNAVDRGANGAFWYPGGTTCPGGWSANTCQYAFYVVSARLASEPDNPDPHWWNVEPYDPWNPPSGRFGWVPVRGTWMRTGSEPTGLNAWNDKSVFDLPQGTYTMCVEAQEMTGFSSSTPKYWVAQQLPTLNLSAPYKCSFSFCENLQSWSPQLTWTIVKDDTKTCASAIKGLWHNWPVFEMEFDANLVTSGSLKECAPYSRTNLKFTGNPVWISSQEFVLANVPVNLFGNSAVMGVSGKLSADRKALTLMFKADRVAGLSFTFLVAGSNLPAIAKPPADRLVFAAEGSAFGQYLQLISLDVRDSVGSQLCGSSGIDYSDSPPRPPPKLRLTLRD